MTGVVNTTSPSRRSRTSRIFTRWQTVSVRLDGGLVQQHDRDVVLDGEHTMALPALQARAVLHQRHRGLAARTGQDLQQFSVHWHGEILLENQNYSTRFSAARAARRPAHPDQPERFSRMVRLGLISVLTCTARWFWPFS